MAVDSMVPRMNGSSPYWPWVGFHVFPKIQEKPSVEKAGLAWMTMATRNQTASAPNSSGDDAQDRPGSPCRAANRRRARRARDGRRVVDGHGHPRRSASRPTGPGGPDRPDGHLVSSAWPLGPVTVSSCVRFWFCTAGGSAT